MYVLWEHICSGSCMPSGPNFRAVRNNHSRKKQKQPYQRSNNARQDPTIQTLLTIVLSLSLSPFLSLWAIMLMASNAGTWQLSTPAHGTNILNSKWSCFPQAPTSIRDILTVAKGPMLGSLCTVTWHKPWPILGSICITHTHTKKKVKLVQGGAKWSRACGRYLYSWVKRTQLTGGGQLWIFTSPIQEVCFFSMSILPKLFLGQSSNNRQVDQKWLVCILQNGSRKSERVSRGPCSAPNLL